jgi:hypothetical protein
MMPPMSPPQGTRGAAERSDSSGLVEGDPAAWESGSEPDAPDAPSGTQPGDAAGSTTAPPPAAPPLLPGVPLIGVPRGGDRDERADQIPAGAERTARTEADQDRDDDPALVPPFLPPAASNHRRRREERSAVGELLSEQDTTWDPAAGPAPEATAGDEDLPPDYVAMVRESDDDFSSWDADPLPWVSDQSPAGEDDPDSWGVPPAAAEASPPPAELDEPPRTRPRPSGQSFEAALLAEMPMRAGGPDLTPEELRERAEQLAEKARRSRIKLGLEKGDDEDEEEEPMERRAADLLDRDDAQWSRRADDTVGGVIE